MITHIHNTITCSMSSSSSSSKIRFIDTFVPAKTPIKRPQDLSIFTFGNVARHEKLHYSLVNTSS